MVMAYLKEFKPNEHMRAALTCESLDMPRLFRECAKYAYDHPMSIVQVTTQFYLLRSDKDGKTKSVPMHCILRDGNIALLNPVALISQQALHINQFNLPFDWQLFNKIITQVPMHAHNDGRIINATTPNGKKIKFHPGDVILKEED